MSSGFDTFRKTGKLPSDERLKQLGLLIVDDEGEIVRSLKETFSASFEIFEATSGDAALEIVRTRSPKIVISDQRMPKMTGVELFSKIKEISPNTIRIILTGYSDIDVVATALNQGLAWKYITKPWDAEMLRALVIEGARLWLRNEGKSPGDVGLTSAFLGM